nr:hypothetical protein [Tanacetum cinerariifolium]
EETESGKGGDEVSESEGESDDKETRQKEEESFDLIPRTPDGSEDESNDEEDQELSLSEDARIQEEEEADELYRDVNINQGRGLQVTQNVEDSHVTLTPVNLDDKAILDTYEEATILKRRREDDDQEGPSAGSDRGSKRQVFRQKGNLTSQRELIFSGVQRLSTSQTTTTAL